MRPLGRGHRTRRGGSRQAAAVRRIAERQKGVARKLRNGKLGRWRWMGYSGQLKYNKRGDTRFVRGRPANQKEH